MGPAPFDERAQVVFVDKAIAANLCDGKLARVMSSVNKGAAEPGLVEPKQTGMNVWLIIGCLQSAPCVCH